MGVFAQPGRPAGRWAALLLAAALAGAPAPASAEEESAAYEAITGVGAGLFTLVYSPLKVAYALSGSVVSGLAWLWTLGDRDIAGPIFTSAVRGDYVVTPSHLDGRRDLHFFGPRY